MQLGSRQFALALSIILLALPLAGAFNAATDYSAVRMTSCSAGQIYAYAQNTENYDSTLTISAYFGKLYGSVASPVQALPAHQSRGSKITVYSGSCFKGDEDVTVYFNICKNATLDSCTQIRKTVRMVVEPCTACPSYVEQHLPPVDNYAPATSTCVGSGCGQPLASSIYFESAYEPSDISIDISFARESYSLVAGSSVQTDVTVTNRGVPVTLDLSLEGYAPELGASLSEHTIGLEAYQSRQVALSVNPDSSMSGQYCLDVVASRRGVDVERRTACFSVIEAASALVSAPASAGSSECGKDASYSITVQNTGAFINTFAFSSESNAVRVVPSKVTIPAGESATATVTVNASKLAFAQDIQVTVTGGRTGGPGSKAFSETVVTSVSASGCEAESTVSSQNRNFTVVESFHNPSLQTVYGVSGTIEGLPAGFVVEQEEGLQDVAPGASVDVSLSVTAPANAPGEVSGVLVLRSQDGTIIRQRPIVLSTVGEGGVTGFFTKAVGSNLSLIIALLIGAAVVALLYGRADLRQTVSEKVEGAKKAVAKAVERPAGRDAGQAGKAEAETGDSATVTNS